VAAIAPSGSMAVKTPYSSLNDMRFPLINLDFHIKHDVAGKRHVVCSSGSLIHLHVLKSVPASTVRNVSHLTSSVVVAWKEQLDQAVNILLGQYTTPLSSRSIVEAIEDMRCPSQTMAQATKSTMVDKMAH
jgi:hypothetical protein